jgi:hypothetical protein
MCGYYELRQFYNKKIITSTVYSSEELERLRLALDNVHRKITHFTEISLPQARQFARTSANLENHRVDYLLEKISKEKLNDLAMRALTIHNKNIKIVDLYELLCVFGREFFAHLLSCGKSGDELITEIKMKYQEFNDLRMFCNIEFAKISITYGVTVPYINKKYEEKSKKYKKADAENNYEIINNPPKIQKPVVTV